MKTIKTNNQKTFTSLNSRGQTRGNLTGFTLIELLVVISIIGLLSTIAMVAFNTARSRARDARRVSDIKQLRSAIDLYYNDKGYYPEFTSITNCSVEYNNALNALITQGLMSRIPRDPQFRDVHPYRQCYNYLGIGQAQTYGSSSGLYCGSRVRTDYRWSLLFSTEAVTYNYDRDGSNSYVYCIHGDLMPGL